MREVIAAVLGGVWGGAIVGIAEAALVAATAGPGEEYWLFPYAVVSYGFFGAIIGVGTLLLIGVVKRVAGAVRRDTFGLSVALAFLALGTTIARYHVIQRVFHEELVTTSTTGLLVHAVILLVMAVLTWLVMRMASTLHRRGLPLLAVAGALALLVITMGAALASPKASGTAVARTTGAAAKGHPNVILIIADTLRADALGCYGAPADATPAIDRFATEAVRFSNTYSQSTWTRPSIATILTSLYPSVHGAYHKMDPLPERVTTLAEALRANGYWTAGFVSNINVAPVFNYQQGFAEYSYLAPSFYFWATDSATRLAIYKGLRVIRERLFRDRIYFYNYYQDAEVVGDAVGRWLDQRPPNPFFLFIHYMDPHDPYFEIPYDGHGVARVTEPDPPRQRKDELHRLYGEDVRYLDDHLGALFARLKADGLYDDSVILLTADHGEEFQEHGGWWHGTSLYQEQMHVPLLVKRTHEPGGNTVEPRLARCLDVAPTLMAAARLVPPPEFQGLDLFGSTTPTDSFPLYAEEDLEGNVLASLRLGPWKIITANPGNPRGLKPVELYNLERDAAERNDVAASEPERTRQMLQLLSQERARITKGGQLSQVDQANHVADHRS